MRANEQGEWWEIDAIVVEGSYNFIFENITWNLIQAKKVIVLFFLANPK